MSDEHAELRSRGVWDVLMEHHAQIARLRDDMEASKEDRAGLRIALAPMQEMWKEQRLERRERARNRALIRRAVMSIMLALVPLAATTFLASIHAPQELHTFTSALSVVAAGGIAFVWGRDGNNFMGSS